MPQRAEPSVTPPKSPFTQPGSPLTQPHSSEATRPRAMPSSHKLSSAVSTRRPSPALSVCQSQGQAHHHRPAWAASSQSQSPLHHPAVWRWEAPLQRQRTRRCTPSRHATLACRQSLCRHFSRQLAAAASAPRAMWCDRSRSSLAMIEETGRTELVEMLVEYPRRLVLALLEMYSPSLPTLS